MRAQRFHIIFDSIMRNISKKDWLVLCRVVGHQVAEGLRFSMNFQIPDAVHSGIFEATILWSCLQLWPLGVSVHQEYMYNYESEGIT